MEKAVSPGKRKPCPGLLSGTARKRKALLGACAFFFCAASLFALETEMAISDPPFVAGERLTLSFLFYGTAPNALFFEGEKDAGNAASSSYYIEESFPPSFAVESIKKSLASPPRSGVFAASRTRAALVTIEAIPQEAGSFDIGPFAFIANGERATFPQVRIVVESPASPAENSGEDFNLFWLIQSDEGAELTPPADAASLEAGRGALIVLMAPLAAKGSVACPAPENALLEGANVNPLEIADMLPEEMPSECAPIAAYIWTPLFEGRQSLPRAAFSPASGGSTSFAQEESVDVAAPQIAKIAESSSDAPPIASSPSPSPKKPAALLPRDTDSSLEASLASAASSLWDAGERAKAAVMLRAAENVFFFKPRIGEMRGAVDEALMVEGKSCGGLERALFFAPFALIAVSFILFASLILYSLISRKKGGECESFFSKRKSLAACVILAALGMAGALCSSFVGMEEAAATGGFLFRVPDEAAAAVAELKDGAPLKIQRRTQSWLYAKTFDGAAGWYPSYKIIVYRSRNLHEFWRY